MDLGAETKRPTGGSCGGAQRRGTWLVCWFGLFVGLVWLGLFVCLLDLDLDLDLDLSLSLSLSLRMRDEPNLLLFWDVWGVFPGSFCGSKL